MTTTSAAQSQSVPASPITENVNSLLNYRSEASNVQQFILSSSTSVTTSAATPSSTQALQPSNDLDIELNEILDKVIDIVPDSHYDDILKNLDGGMIIGSRQQEEIAQINKIQQSLMQCEEENNFGSNSPPAYPMHGLTPQQILQRRQQQQQQSQSQAFPPPPLYQQRNIRLPQQNQQNPQLNNIVTGSSNVTVAQATNSHQQPNKYGLNMNEMQIFQEQQKKRLLQQQKNQQMVVPVNAQAGPNQLCK